MASSTFINRQQRNNLWIVEAAAYLLAFCLHVGLWQLYKQSPKPQQPEEPPVIEVALLVMPKPVPVAQPQAPTSAAPPPVAATPSAALQPKPRPKIQPPPAPKAAPVPTPKVEKLEPLPKPIEQPKPVEKPKPVPKPKPIPKPRPKPEPREELEESPPEPIRLEPEVSPPEPIREEPKESLPEPIREEPKESPHEPIREEPRESHHEPVNETPIESHHEAVREEPPESEHEPSPAPPSHQQTTEEGEGHKTHGEGRNTDKAEDGAEENNQKHDAHIIDIEKMYPPLANRRGWEGTVKMKIHISANGEALDVTVVTSSGHPVLDEAAVDMMKNAKFAPARRGDKPIDSIATISYKFTLPHN